MWWAAMPDILAGGRGAADHVSQMEIALMSQNDMVTLLMTGFQAFHILDLRPSSTLRHHCYAVYLNYLRVIQSKTDLLPLRATSQQAPEMVTS